MLTLFRRFLRLCRFEKVVELLGVVIKCTAVAVECTRTAMKQQSVRGGRSSFVARSRQPSLPSKYLISPFLRHNTASKTVSYIFLSVTKDIVLPTLLEATHLGPEVIELSLDEENFGSRAYCRG